MSRFSMDWSELSLQVMITFGHFLWQACVVGVVLLVVQHVAESLRDSRILNLRRGCKKDVSLGETDLHGANIRYAIACMAFFSLPICVIATFAWVHQSHGPIMLSASDPIDSPSSPMVSATEAMPTMANSDIPVLPPPTMPKNAEVPATEPIEPPTLEVESQASSAQRIQAFSPYLLVAYMVGVGFMLARFLLSIIDSSRLRRTIQPITDVKLLKTIAEQCARVGLKRVPVVALCQRVSVPVVVGIVKPMILLPPALLCGLEPNQVAAILSHELAHIRRYDLIVNVLQRVVEALLFFHPVMWWISRRVSIERENCCDDLAATGCGRFEYAAALLRMAERCAAIRGIKIAPQLESLAADGGSSSQLGHRIKRLLGENDSPRILFTRGTIAAIALTAVFGGLSMIAVGQSSGDKPLESQSTNDNSHLWGEESHGLLCRIVPVSPSMDAENVDLSVPQDRFESPDDITFAVEIKNVSDKTISIRDIRFYMTFKLSSAVQRFPECPPRPGIFTVVPKTVSR